MSGTADVRLVEYGVVRHPEGMDGWRMFRIEYGGFNEQCVTEGMIWLPPGADPEELEKWINERR